jgi:CHAD domain-containing protein
MAKPTMPPGLGPRSLLRTASARLLSARLSDVREYEETLLRSLPEDAVHDMRVASRRLRAALRLLGNAPLRKLEPAVKELQDALGAVRDVQLQITWLIRRSRKLAERRREVLPSAAAALRRALDVWRSRTFTEIAEEIPWLDRPGRLGGPRIRRALKKRLGSVEERLLAALDNPDAPTTHRLRIGVKKLRYFCELAEPALPQACGDLLEELEPMQERLGELHDVDVRIGLLEEMGAHALRKREQAHRAALARRLQTELRRWRDEKLARRFGKQLRKAGKGMGKGKVKV